MNIPARTMSAHVYKWRARYILAQRDFVRGSIGELEATQALADLNFKGEALDVELLEFKRERRKWRLKNGMPVECMA